MMQPMFDDLLRLQAIEFNDYIRKSAYTDFMLMVNELDYTHYHQSKR